MTESELRQQVLDKASEYIGCVYGDQKLYDLYDLYNEHIPEFVEKWGTRSCKMLHSYKGYCALFVSMIQYLCGNHDIQPMEIAPYEMVAYIAKKRDGLWQPYGNGYVPQPGDNILFDWTGKRANGLHIGFVYSYDSTTGIITTLEGNATGVEKNQTIKRTFKKDDSSIMGYITPDYASKTTSEEPTIETTEVSNLTSEGYTVTATFTAPRGLKYVKMPTWTANSDQDDLIWHTAKVVGTTATFDVSIYDHKGEYGKYYTHVYVYDVKGKYAMKALTIEVPEPTVDPQEDEDTQVDDTRSAEQQAYDMLGEMQAGDIIIFDSINSDGKRAFKKFAQDNTYYISQ